MNWHLFISIIKRNLIMKIREAFKSNQGFMALSLGTWDARRSLR